MKTHHRSQVRVQDVPTTEAALVFAHDWITAWNQRDLDQIMRHYSADIDFASPFIGRLLGSETDRVLGIVELRNYFGCALRTYPDLRFRFRHAFFGVKSLVLEYQSVSNLAAAEFMEFNDAGLVCRVRAHYGTFVPLSRSRTKGLPDTLKTHAVGIRRLEPVFEPADVRGSDV